MSAPINWDLWREIITKTVGKSSKKHWKSIVIDILSVDCAIKPTYLFDQMHTTTKSLAALLSVAKMNNLLFSSLGVLSVGEDLFVYNCNGLKMWINSCLNFNFVRFVDISSELNIPRLITAQSIVKDLTTILDSLIQSSSTSDTGSGLCLELESSLVVLPCDKWNLTTVFGCLLGYPVVYWFDNTRGQDSQNCLSMTPLVVVKVHVTVTYPDDAAVGIKHCVTSFSVPECLFDEAMDKHVNNWFSAVNSRLEERQNSWFSNVKMTRSNVTLQTVAL